MVLYLEATCYLIMSSHFCDALLCLSHTLQSALESGLEARIVQVDFSAPFDRVNHEGILFKLCSVGIGVCVVYTDTVFIKPITERYAWWMVVAVNWLTLHQESRRAVFWARYFSSCTFLSFFPFWKISWSVILITPLWWLLCHPYALE